MKNIDIIVLEPMRWQEYKSLRLEAVQQDPSAFGSNYVEEIIQTDDFWEKRVTTAFNRDGFTMLCAEFDGKLVGMMGSGWSQRVNTKHIATIYSVYVTKSMRGNGVGSLLLEALLKDLATLPLIEKVNLTVTIDQESAIALYEKFGFKQVGIAKKELKIDGQYYDIAYMEKFL
jgi:RimJ/RimL family protein N-acetyltransferase